MDSTSLIMGAVILVVIMIPVIILARLGNLENKDKEENK
jgi:ABC-type phosphate transport system permease subunit